MIMSELRSKILSRMAADLSNSGQLEDLEVDEGETLVLSYQSRRLRASYREFQPKSVDEIKDLLGVPDMPFRRLSEASLMMRELSRVGTADLTSLSARIMPSLPSRVISPDSLKDPTVSEDEKVEIKKMARSAADAYIYGVSTTVASWKPLIDAYFQVDIPRLVIPIFRDITVRTNGTLAIPRNTYVVFANRIQLYGSGKITCSGPTTFDCTSFEGFL
jgi:hypothetical protein